LIGRYSRNLEPCALGGKLDPAAELARVVQLLLHPPAATGDVRSALDGITDAGEALRSGSGRDPRLFTVTT